jgi:hypothetical protein
MATVVFINRLQRVPPPARHQIHIHLPRIGVALRDPLARPHVQNLRQRPHRIQDPLDVRGRPELDHLAQHPQERAHRGEPFDHRGPPLPVRVRAGRR